MMNGLSCKQISVTNSTKLVSSTPDWSLVNSESLSNYQYQLNVTLNIMVVPSHYFNKSVVQSDRVCIDYDAVIPSIQYACKKCIPSKTVTKKDYIIPGWNDYVKEKHDVAGIAMEALYYAPPSLYVHLCLVCNLF